MKFDKNLATGIARGLTYYGIGTLLVWVTYLVFGWEYIHAPGLHHMVGLLVLIIGAVMLIRRIIGAFSESRNSRNTGTMLVHALALLSFIFYLKLDMLHGAIKRDTGDPLPAETVTADRNSQTLLLTNYLQDSLDHPVADSVHVDLRPQ